MSSAKEDVLARVREALGSAPAVPEIPRAYRAAGSLPTAGIVEAFCENVAEYQATVHRVAAADLATTVRAILGDTARVGVPLGFDPLGIDVIEDDALTTAQLDTLDAVVTGSALAIADTGTIVLDSGARSGRRALTLVPDRHVCIVEAGTIVPSVPDAIAQLAAAASEGRPITFVSGPSATSDIELDRVEGVHGPRVLDVIVVA
ncbi:LUD domain-containing protein [Solirubrobacter ginsenosidimutans]|uniref:LUD domain-containing protein n=1 Tax=Solirubrobacter ginsenosidimutans TaxID=490573 RepID=A0A9X3MSK7_9ACTN|nr:LUD domain-containing protein [Solirubrobacter ginsenosidimutans]MDA0161622.1 LUD domain-containing protein [Solirubrobacter ginsenosidimutans]